MERPNRQKRNDTITAILNEFRTSEILLDYEESTEERDSALRELVQKGLLEKTNSLYRLSTEGEDALETNLPYPDCLPKPQIVSPIHVGHNIVGNIHNSNLNQDIGNSILPSKSKTHPMQWVAWIGGIISVGIAIYKLFLEK
jgi:hypothetical protein